MNNYDLLKNFLDEHASVREKFEDIVRGFLSEVGEDQSALPKPDNIITFGGFASWIQQTRRFNDFFEYISKKDVLYSTWIKEKRQIYQTGGITFVNREDEIRALLGASETNKYFLIASPPGYGATYLVDEVARRLQSQKFNQYRGWEYVQVQIVSGSGVRESLKLIADQLAMSLENWENINEGEFCENFIRTYRSFRRNQQKRPDGVYFLIDFQGNPNIEVFQLLVEKVFPKIIDFHNNIGRIRTRILLIGRFVTNHQVRWRDTKIRFVDKPNSLTPLEYGYVLETTKKFLNINSQRAAQIAAHIFYHTGGHPGSMVALLRAFRDDGLTIDEFFATEREPEIWKDYVRNKAQTVYQELEEIACQEYESYKIDDETIKNIFERLSVFRLIPRNALLECANLSDNGKINFLDLRSALQDTYMLSLNNNLLKDNIYRRLIQLSLKYENSQEKEYECRLQKVLNWGIRITRSEIKNRQLSAQWALEWLYQKLLLTVLCDKPIDKEARKGLKQKFFNEILNELLEIYKERWNECNEYNKEEDSVYLVEAIKDMEQQKELRFMFNYLLRGKEYNGKPIQELRQRFEVWQRDTQ